MSNHVYKGAWTKKECQSFTRRLESTWNKQQKAKKMERKFVGHVISGGPVTMRAAREAGLIKGEPKESTQEELDEAVRTMEGIEETVKKARKMKNVVIVDIDGTISKVGERLKYLRQEPKDWDSFYNDCFDDEPIPEIIRLLRHLYPKYNIIFCTGRRESCSSKTSRWMAVHTGYLFNCPILFRKNSDKRHDTEVKPELLEIAGFTPENVAFILEDRTSMVRKWRELGFTCLQVADGDF